MQENIDMGLTKEEKAKRIAARQDSILAILREAGGVTGNQLAQMCGVSRGTVMKDIAALRRRGYPIQISSMGKENGLLVAVYELPKYR